MQNVNLSQAAPIEVGLSYSRQVWSERALPLALFNREAETRCLRVRFADSWASDKASSRLREVVDAEQIYSLGKVDNLTDILALEGGLVLLGASEDGIDVDIAASTPARKEEILSWLHETFPKPQIDEAVPRVQVRFWHQSGDGPTSVRRWLEVSEWPHVADNYPKLTRDSLGRLIDLPAGNRRNGLILWHGRPGTGKTHALRALSWAWHDWASVHYIVDPETLLGSAPDYLFHVIARIAEETDEAERWSVLVLEDTGELLSADAKARVGQALSRLLNLSDGLLGQDMRLITLVTTNEALASIHPAVARPGRCLSETEFTSFPQEEARRWLLGREQAKVAARVGPGGCSLAELFALAQGAIEYPEVMPLAGASYL